MPQKRIKILSVGADRITSEEALERIGLFLRSGAGHRIVTLNSEMAVCAEQDQDFRRIVNSSDLVVADGMGILQAASYLARRKGYAPLDLLLLAQTWLLATLMPGRVSRVLPEKISGIDLIYLMLADHHMEGKRVYLLGGGSGIAAEAGRRLQSDYPLVRIVGAEEGFFGHMAPEENMRLLRRIDSTRPDVILVALGAPKQEKWIAANLERLPSVRLAMGVGGSFDVIAGKIRRAPVFMQTRGLEWLWRLSIQPWRLKRIWNASLRFSWLIFTHKEDKIS